MYPIIGYLGFWGIVIIELVLGKYMIVKYLDPLGWVIPDTIRKGPVSGVAVTRTVVF